jgi:hypothetical protein
MQLTRADNRRMSTQRVHASRPIAIAFAGLLALAIAMGIGRFAFTPLLPMMLHDGVVDLPGASWLATANYLGYWLGAMGCALQPALWRRWGLAPLVHTSAVRIGLVATVLLTLGMALPWSAAWALWRGLAGVASALVFVYVSGWCLARLSALGAPSLAGIIYVGPGLGIAISGLAATAMVAHGVRAATGWAVFALLALALTVLAWPRLRGVVTVSSVKSSAESHPPLSTIAAFTLAYGLAAALGPPPPADGLLWHASHGCAARCLVAHVRWICARQPAARLAVHGHNVVRDARSSTALAPQRVGTHRSADGRLRPGADPRAADGGLAAAAQRRRSPELRLGASNRCRGAGARPGDLRSPRATGTAQDLNSAALPAIPPRMTSGRRPGPECGGARAFRLSVFCARTARQATVKLAARLSRPRKPGPRGRAATGRLPSQKG